MQQRVVPRHGQFGVGEGELGVVLGRRGRDEVRGQVAGLVIGVRQGADLIRPFESVALTPVLGVAAELGIAQVVVHRHRIAGAGHQVRIPIDQAHVGRHIRPRVMLLRLLLLLLLVNGTFFALGAAPGIRRIETVLGWKDKK